MNYTEMAQHILETMKNSGRKPGGKHFEDAMRGEAMIMKYVVEQGGIAAPGNIAKAVGLTSARVASALNSLEKKEFLCRKIDPKDRRKIIVTLTEKGLQETEIRHEAMLKNVVQMLAYLGEADAEACVRILDKLQSWEPECWSKVK